MLSQPLKLMLAGFAIYILSTSFAFAKPLDAGGSKKAEEKRDDLRKRIEEKKLENNGSEWQVSISSQTGKGSLSGPDTLTFQNGLFNSKTASKHEYTPTNYTLTVS